MSKKNKVKAIIGGTQYVLQGDKPEAHLYEVASFVDRKMDDVRELDISNRMSTTQVAMLTSINLADELFETRKQLEKQSLENNGFYTEFDTLEEQNIELKEKIEKLQNQSEN